MLHLGAIADDLTGATDLALTLSRQGMRVLQVVGVPEDGAKFGDATAVVVSLKTRTVPAPEAVAQSLAAAGALLAAGAGQLFFKYCSTFDSTDAGNIGPVTDALLDLLDEPGTIACPAFPANKRTLFKGHLFVGDVLLSESSMKDHPLTPMRDANLVRVLQRQISRPVDLVPLEAVRSQGLASKLDAIRGVAIVDAVEDSDLFAIGVAARGLKLVTGGSGVALGLPANFAAGGDNERPPMPVVEGRSVIIAGSCSAATLRQIAVAIAAGMPALKIEAEDIAAGRTSAADAASFVLSQPAGTIPMIYSSADPATVLAVQQKLGRLEAGELIEHFMGAVAAEIAKGGVTRFLVAGGETSGAVVAALGVKAMLIGDEIDPGVPWTFSHGNAQPLALALKSGNFGADDFFLKAWAQLK